jgi:hypothetical protein
MADQQTGQPTDRSVPPLPFDARRMDELDAEARYHRERYDLYRAKMQSSRPTSLERLRELERSHRSADARLLSARRENALERERRSPW